MVVNGAAEGVGSEQGRDRGADHAPRAKPARRIPAWRCIGAQNGALAVDVGDGASPPTPPRPSGSSASTGARHPVLRGENEGHTLTEYQAVRSYRRIGAWAGWSMELIVPPDEAKALGDGGVAVLLQAQAPARS